MTWNINEGKLLFDEKEILTSLNEKCKVKSDVSLNERGCFIEFSKELDFATAYWKNMRIPELDSFTALYRFEPYWFRPHFGNKLYKLPQRNVVIWLRRKDNLKVILVPLIHKGYCCYINRSENGFELMADNNCDYGNIRSLVGLYVGVHENPYELFNEAAEAIKDFIPQCSLREEKNLPPWIDLLGYCTWNTFYTKINQENTIRMLHYITNDCNIQLGFFLLDDGWQKTKNRKLFNKGVNDEKFPNGFKQYSEFIKNKFGIKHFLVWHTMQGYWFGISHLFGKYRKKFQLIKNLPKYGPSNTQKGWMPIHLFFFTKLLKMFRIFRWPFGVIPPKEMNKFWKDYHGWLADQGINAVKVDNQSGQQLHCYNLGNQASIMKLYHDALERSVEMHFSESNIINCMSQNTDVYYQINKSSITRNSQDYYPGKEIEQTQHVIINAYNDLWCGQFAHPDWDMFQTKHAWGEYQAASRAISGSPIYFADDYLSINPDLIAKIALPNGKIPRCESIALPCRENIFSNPAKPGRALKMFNHNKFNSVLGIFNAMVKQATAVRYAPIDIEGLKGENEFAIFSYKNGKLAKTMGNKSFEIKLDIRGFDILTICLIENGFAPIGMMNMLNPGGIFVDIDNSKEKRILIKVKYWGKIGFYSENKPKSIKSTDEEIPFEYRQKEKLLIVDLPEKRRIFEIYY